MRQVLTWILHDGLLSVLLLNTATHYIRVNVKLFFDSWFDVFRDRCSFASSWVLVHRTLSSKAGDKSVCRPISTLLPCFYTADLLSTHCRNCRAIYIYETLSHDPRVPNVACLSKTTTCNTLNPSPIRPLIHFLPVVHQNTAKDIQKTTIRKTFLSVSDGIPRRRSSTVRQKWPVSSMPVW